MNEYKNDPLKSFVQELEEFYKDRIIILPE